LGLQSRDEEGVGDGFLFYDCRQDGALVCQPGSICLFVFVMPILHEMHRMKA
jgi:hypothetical protein